MPRWADDERKPLARLRAKAKLSQTEASFNLGISITTLVRYESGTHDLSIKLGEQMANLYSVTFDEIRAAVAATYFIKTKVEKPDNLIADVKGKESGE